MSPVGNAVGEMWASWLTPTSLVTGALAVVGSAYLAAVFLVADARRRGDAELEAYFRRRALAAGLITGAMALVGIAVLHADAPYLYEGLTSRGLPLVLLSVACGALTLLLLARGSAQRARVLAAGAVAAVVVGWGVAQHPYLLPTTLTIASGAAPAGTLTALTAVTIAAVVLIGPSLACSSSSTSAAVSRRRARVSWACRRLRHPGADPGVARQDDSRPCPPPSPLPGGQGRRPRRRPGG